MSNGGFEGPKGENGVYVDIVKLPQERNVVIIAKEDPDTTENSSSFGGTISGNDNISGLSDNEVESQILGADDLAPQFDGFTSVFPMRKKKLTCHWRKFVHPLTWRCKWAEIKIKALEAHALKYARLIAIFEQRKRMATDQITVEQSGSRSLPYACRYDRQILMKRRKRKRVEKAIDITSYISNHFLFNACENKRYELDGVQAGEDCGNSDQHGATPGALGVLEDCIFSDDNDTCLEDILCKIELVQSRVQKMKSQLDSVLRNNPSKFSSSENFSQLVPHAQTSSVQSPTLSRCNGDAISVEDLYADFQHIPDYDPGGFIFPDNTLSRFGEAIPVPDIIESTVGLLSSMDVTHHQAQVGDSSEKIVDNILIHNEAVESSMLIDSRNQSSDNLVAAKASATGQLLTPKSCLASEIQFPKNKRKRGERKAGSGNWNRQRPGQSDEVISSKL